MRSAASPGGGPGESPRDPRRPFATSPFSRLARTHALGIAGDALFAIGLAGSVFFSLDFNSARWRVALYLLLTIAPFAVAAPLIGPAIDRIKGGRRWIIVGSMALRAVLCFFVVRHLDSLLFYPEAFGMLVLGKVYTISKSAVVPSTVRSDEELVEANSKLTVISAIAVVVAAAPGGLLLKLGGAGWTLGLGFVVFVGATAMALRLPPISVAEEPEDEREREELRSAAIFLAASSMGLVRGIVGFLSFMLAFDFKNGGVPLWHLGVAAASAQIGFFLGAVLAPRLRRLASEERILIGTMVVTAVGGLLCALLGGLAGAAVLSALVGATGSAAKQAFDAIVQRDAPDANRGRSFARFETRFQLVWVIGALIPIIIPIPADLGFVIIAMVAAFAAGSYMLGLHRIRQGRVPPRRQGLRRVVASVTGDRSADEPDAAPLDTDPTIVTPNPDDRGTASGHDAWAMPAAPLTAPSGAGPGAAPGATARGIDPDEPGARRWVPGTRPEPPLPPPPLPPPPRAAAEPAGWEPPPGFVSARLDQPATGETPAARPWERVFDDTTSLSGARDVGDAAEVDEGQLTLPLDEAAPGPAPGSAPGSGDDVGKRVDGADGTDSGDDAPDDSAEDATADVAEDATPDVAEDPTVRYPDPPWRDASGSTGGPDENTP